MIFPPFLDSAMLADPEIIHGDIYVQQTVLCQNPLLVGAQSPSIGQLKSFHVLKWVYLYSGTLVT
jgi:hypothetical protein